VVIAGHVVPQQPELGAAAIDDPQVQIAVLVPINSGYRTTVVGEVETASCGDICETTIAKIQETAIPLAPAKRSPLA
jgi:hypothetical protein